MQRRNIRTLNTRLSPVHTLAETLESTPSTGDHLAHRAEVLERSPIVATVTLHLLQRCPSLFPGGRVSGVVSASVSRNWPWYKRALPVSNGVRNPLPV